MYAIRSYYVCEREAEVENFIPEEYWTLDAEFHKGRHNFTSQLVLYRGEKPELANEKSVLAIIEEIRHSDCIRNNFV